MLQLREKLSQFWQLQQDLFPWLTENLGYLSEKQQQLVTVLEMARIEEFIRDDHGYVGRPRDQRAAIARAFVAKAVYNYTTTRQLLDRLASDKVLRRICGWEKVSDISEEWTFSRAFAEFSASELGQRVHEALIKKYQADRLVGHISRDSTAIEVREKAAKKKEAAQPKRKAKRGRPPPQKGKSVLLPTNLWCANSTCHWQRYWRNCPSSVTLGQNVIAKAIKKAGKAINYTWIPPMEAFRLVRY
jgi:hypothetical protein